MQLNVKFNPIKCLEDQCSTYISVSFWPIISSKILQTRQKMFAGRSGNIWNSLGPV